MTSAIARWHSSARPPSDALELAYADRLEAEMQELAIQLHKVRLLPAPQGPAPCRNDQCCVLVVPLMFFLHLKPYLVVDTLGNKYTTSTAYPLLIPCAALCLFPIQLRTIGTRGRNLIPTLSQPVSFLW